tara:strand:- start:104 stop:325 length:222 start_codon:yes stop_codon:yes gene_type:complete
MLMSFEFLNFESYGIFIWSAFFLTFASCFCLYFKTKNEFAKYEKMLADDNEFLHSKKILSSEKEQTLIGNPIT